MANLLRVSGIVEESGVDGPGIRYTIFVQGCKHNCKGCHNPQTHDLSGGELVDIDDIYQAIQSNHLLDGVTFSGGEPFLQVPVLSILGRQLKESGYHIIAYTGYKVEALLQDEEKLPLLKVIDLLVDSPFILEERTLELKFRGSRNQRVIDVPKTLKTKQIIATEF